MAVIIGSSLHPMFATENITLESMVTLTEIEHGKIQLKYTGRTPEKLVVHIFDEENQQIFKETLKSKKGIKKPYNISRLPYGNYRFEVRVEDEIVIHKINHVAPAYPGNVKLLAKVFAEDRFKMMVQSEEFKDFRLRIYNDNDQLIFQERILQKDNYGRVVNLEKGFNTRSVRLVLSDANGFLQAKTLEL